VDTRGSRQGSTRRYPRYIFDTEIRVLAGLQAEPVRSRTLDISEGGVAGIFNTGWNIGESAVLQFTIPPTEDVFETRAVVRSRSGARYGFEFVELTAASRSALHNACNFLRTPR
jgi:c-di-GMP-binding flagellar brake protein YcgR